MRRVSKPQEPRGRVRFLSDGERGHLLDVCKATRSPYLYHIVLLALSTGARKGEILGLRWIDGEGVWFRKDLPEMHPWRILWQGAMAAEQSGDLLLAKKAAGTVLGMVPGLVQARQMFERL